MMGKWFYLVAIPAYTIYAFFVCIGWGMWIGDSLWIAMSMLLMSFFGWTLRDFDCREKADEK